MSTGSPPTAPCPPAPAAVSRLGFVDVARGFAVLFMIEWHCIDAWLLPGRRSGAGWAVLVLLGGLAAPAFLFLAGAGVALKLASDARRSVPSASTTWGVAKRGLLLVVLGTVLHLQLVLTDRGSPRSLLRFDVLHCIGVSIALTAAVALVLRVVPRHPGRLVVAAIAVLALTPVLRDHLPPMHEVLMAPLVRLDEQQLRGTLALFPLFPWWGPVLLGAATGLVWDRAGREGHVLRVVALGGAFGLLLAIGCADPVPWHRWVVHAIPGYDPTTVTRHVARAGAVLFVALLSLGLCRAAPPLARVLAQLGQASLPVYWIHVSLAYGELASPIKRKLEYGWALAGLAAMVAAMYVVARIRLGPYEHWLRSRRERRSRANASG